MSDSSVPQPRDMPPVTNTFGALCPPPDFHHVTDLVTFRANLPVHLRPSPLHAAGTSSHSQARTLTTAGQVGFGIEVALQQRWRWEGQRLSPSQASVDVAPGEEQLIKVTTMRRLLHRKRRRRATETTSQTETGDSTQSSINVTQTFPRRRNIKT